MSALLVIVSILATLIGVALASNATIGAVVVMVGVVAAVLARMAQASAHHAQLQAALKSLANKDAGAGPN